MKATKPLKEAEVKTENGEIVVLEKRGDDHTWGGSFVVWAGERQGVAGDQGPAADRSDDLCRSTWWTATTRPTTRRRGRSRPCPTCRRRSCCATASPRPGPDSVVPLAVDATDDHGLAEIRLRYRVNGDEAIRELAGKAFPELNHEQEKWEFPWNLAAAEAEGPRPGGVLGRGDGP